MASSNVLRFSIHRHWKKSPPNTHALSLIRQVRYELEFDEDQNDGMLDVFEINILKPKNEQKKLWRRFPASYLPFLKRILYQCYIPEFGTLLLIFLSIYGYDFILYHMITY